MLLIYRVIFIIIIFFNTILISCSQNTEFKIIGNGDKVVIPFEFQYNYIIVKVLVSGVFELRFLVDTGAEYSAITQKEVADLMGIQYSRKINVLGADQKTLLKAFVGTGVDLSISNLDIKNYNLLVLTEGFPQFDLLSNMRVSGIIGADVLSRYNLKLDFKRKELTLFSRSKPILTNGYSRLPLTLAKSKPYLNLSVKIKGDSSRNLKLLFDTGAGLPLLIIHNTLDSNLMPSSVITGRLGMGLGGFIEGTIGKINSFSIGEFTLHNVVTSFQFLDSKLDSISLLQKNGIIGNDIIRLFDWYLDYGNEFCYFKPNKDYKKAPVYDMSGMVLMAYGEDLNNYEVIDITKGSAAFYQDIRQGDVIKSVNRWPRYLLSYQKIVKILSNKEGDDVRIILKRGEKTLKKHIRLKNIL